MMMMMMMMMRQHNCTGMGLEGDDVGKYASLFYTDDSTVGSQDPEWLQNVNQYLCNLFCNFIGLKPNTKKTEVMICHPGAIWG